MIELEKENAVSDFRKLIGSTNPKRQKKGLSEKNMLHRLKQMQFMDLTPMKMLNRNRLFSKIKIF